MLKMSTKPKVAITHDYLNAYGGAESVANAIWELYPDAPIYTALYDSKAFAGTDAFKGADIRCPRLAKHPLMHKFYKYLVPLYPLLFERLDLSSYDIVISSSANFAKGVRTRKEQLHISYIHTPPRFLYGYPTETSKRDIWYWKPVLKCVDFFLRKWDQRRLKGPIFFYATQKKFSREFANFIKEKPK